MKGFFTLVCIAALSYGNISYAQSTPSMKVNELERFSLVHQVPAMAGYDIRARRIVVPAGVKIEQHEHSQRPGIVYVESGSIVEFRGEKARLLQAGDSLIEDQFTVHSYENQTTTDCVLIAFDLPKQLNSHSLSGK